MEPVQWGDTWAERWPGIVTDKDFRDELRQRREASGLSFILAGRLVGMSPTWVRNIENGDSSLMHPWASKVFDYCRDLGFSQVDTYLAMREFGFLPERYMTVSYFLRAISGDGDDAWHKEHVAAVIADCEREAAELKAALSEKLRKKAAFKRDLVLLEVQDFDSMYQGEIDGLTIAAAAEKIHSKRHGDGVPSVAAYKKAVSRYRKGERFPWRIYRCGWMKRPKFWSAAEWTDWHSKDGTGMMKQDDERGDSAPKPDIEMISSKITDDISELMGEYEDEKKNG